MRRLLLWIALGTATGLALLMGIGLFGRTPLPVETVSVPLHRFPPDSVTLIESLDVFVVRKADKTVSVFLNKAAHHRGSIGWIKDQRVFYSPAHAEVYSIDGRCLAGPCTSASLYRVWSRIDDGVLHIRPRQVLDGGFPNERRGIQVIGGR